jgi:glycosyltransferase involved in cell wall biosynthesis
MTQRCVALLGRTDTPTDAVEDYCRYLGATLEQHGIALELMRVKWAEKSWRDALREVRSKVEEQPESWFLVQHTALAWSRRGFPLRLPGVIRFLKSCGARCAVVFHDATPYGGSRIIDRFRRTMQIYSMKSALRLADLAILTIPPEKVPWVPKSARNIVFIPVGANLPAPERAWSLEKNGADGAATIGVFSVSLDDAGRYEVERIAETVRYAAEKTGKLRLVVLGRNSEEAGRQLQQVLTGAPVEVVAHGLLSAEEIVRILGSCHAMLFTRGQISTRRGSAIAGIACGLPVIAPEGSETAPPVTEAGVVLVPAEARDDFGPALVRVLTDKGYRESLAERSRRSQDRYFSWSAISAQYVKALLAAETEHPRGLPRAKGPVE